MSDVLDGLIDDVLAQALRELRAELGGELPAGLQQLSHDAVQELLSAVRAQKAEQRARLEDAINEGLKVVPTLLRGAVRKILFKGG